MSPGEPVFPKEDAGFVDILGRCERVLPTLRERT